MLYGENRHRIAIKANNLYFLPVAKLGGGAACIVSTFWLNEGRSGMNTSKRMMSENILSHNPNPSNTKLRRESNSSKPI